MAERSPIQDSESAVGELIALYIAFSPRLEIMCIVSAK